jgi:hypothetical protein
MAKDNIRDLDKAWSADKIAILVNGEVTGPDGETIEGLSAFELRCLAESSGRDFADIVLEYAQLDRAISRGIQRDHEVRIAMKLRTKLGLDEYEIEQLLKSKRPGYALLQRGIELVRRHEKGQHSQLRRVRASKGQGDTPVCWACLKTEVKQPGDYCGCREAREQVIRSRRPTTGPFARGYDPAERPDPSSMTDEERAAEIALLADTQQRGPIAGGELYRKRVNPIGVDIRDPDDVREKDRRYWAAVKRDGGAAEKW